MTTKGHILIAMFSDSTLVEFEVSSRIHADLYPLALAGYQSSQLFRHSISDVCGARNGVFAEAFAGDFTDLICIDADVAWEPGAIQTLLSHPVDVVMGAYTQRIEGGKFSILAIDPGKPLIPDGPNGLIEVAGMPMGFARISRRCIERMIAAYGDRWYSDPQVSMGKAWNVFEFAVIDNQRWGEDKNFCRLWREIGGKVYVDPNMTLTHYGRKGYAGRLAAVLNNGNTTRASANLKSILTA